MSITLGIFAKTYERATVEEVFAAVATDGLAAVQFNFVSARLPPLPDALDPTIVARVRRAAEANGIAIASLSATFNLIHPGPEVVADGLRRLEVLAESAGELGTALLTLCTGTRDRANMWRRHPDNDLPDAWADLLHGMTAAVAIAERHDVTLGVEPEPGNVVTTARHARRLLDELPSDRIGIVLDPANVIEGLAPGEVDGSLEEAIGLLADRTVMVHGKDRDEAGRVQPPGQGIVPWDRFLTGVRDAGFAGPLIIHGLTEADVPGAVATLKRAMSNEQ